MSVFAQDKRLVRILRKEMLYIRRAGVHLRFHIGGFVITSVMHDALIVNEAGAVKPAEFLRHLVDDRPSEAFISA